MSIGKLARVAVGVIAILGVIGLSAATAQPVAAATYDNVNPDGNACQNTAIVARHKDILDNQNKIAGYVELRYSTACRTVWARVHGPKGSQGDSYGPRGYVHRNSDGKQLSVIHCDSTGTNCWSNMLNDAGVTSYAHGNVDESSAGPFEATTTSY
jgi:Protein of unknown function (DUF2690)